MKHPDPKYQKNQDDFIKQCPENQKAFHERLFRIGNTAYVYHQRATLVNDKIQKEYYHEWLEGLPVNIRKDMKDKGFEACKTMIPFTRYINERCDIGMDEWMRNNLNTEDYKFWLEEGKTNSR